MAEGDNANNGAATPWYQGVEGVDDVMVGHVQTKGWDKLPAAAVAVQAIKAHREAEKMIGMRADHDFIPVPRDPTKGDMNPVWERLGRPKVGTEYDFKDVTFKDGTQLEDSFVNTMRDTLFKANVPKQYAPDVVKGVVNYLDAADAAEAAEAAAKVVTERAALSTNWGTTPDKLAAHPFMAIAQRAALALGVDAEAVAALEGKVGYSKVMNMFYNIGRKTGEDTFVTGDNKGVDQGGMMSREQALARKAELSGDKAWVTKFLAGDVQAKREMAAIDTILTPRTTY